MNLRIRSHVSERVIAAIADDPTVSATLRPADQRHLEGCARCRRLLEGHRRAGRLLRAPWDFVPSPAGVTPPVVASPVRRRSTIHAAPASGVRGRGVSARLAVTVVAVAAVASVALVSALGTISPSSGPPGPGAVPPPARATRIFFANNGSGTIGVANIDGTGVNAKLITGALGACGVLVVDGHVYWGSNGVGHLTTIGRANLDGTGLTQKFITGADSPCGVATDGTYLYWANTGSSTRVRRARRSGGPSSTARG